jgi:hypothetical protein
MPTATHWWQHQGEQQTKHRLHAVLLLGSAPLPANPGRDVFAR